MSNFGRLSRVNVDLFAGTCNGTSTKPEPYKVVLGLSFGSQVLFPRTALALAILPAPPLALAPALALVGARDGTSFGNWHNRIRDGIKPSSSCSCTSTLLPSTLLITRCAAP